MSASAGVSTMSIATSKPKPKRKNPDRRTLKKRGYNRVDPELRVKVGAWLREIRGERTQTEMALALGHVRCPNVIYQIEVGKITIPFDQISRFARVYETEQHSRGKIQLYLVATLYPQYWREFMSLMVYAFPERIEQQKEEDKKSCWIDQLRAAAGLFQEGIQAREEDDE
jgi:hypothetical protein